MNTSLLRRSALGLVLLGLHTVVVVFVWCISSTSEGPENWLGTMVWLPVWYADYPVAAGLKVWDEPIHDVGAMGVIFLLAGGLQWLLIGMGLQSFGRLMVGVRR